MFAAARDGEGRQAPFASLLGLVEGKQDLSLAPWDLPNPLVAPFGSVLPWSQPQPVLGFGGFCCPLTSLAAQLPSSSRQNLRWFVQKADFLLAS